MSKPPAPCNKCKTEMTPVVLEPFGAEDGGLRLTVRGMPAVTCAQGHKRFLYPEFAALLMDLVRDPEQYQSLQAAVKKGLFKKRYHCGGCGEELPAAATGARKLELKAELKHSDPFRVAVEIPAYRCACGQESVHGPAEASQLAFKAIGHAYRGVDIHPT
ncbi:MAG: hypothetical protein ACYDA8_07480 [Deferrisomatales bacterium]